MCGDDPCIIDNGMPYTQPIMHERHRKGCIHEEFERIAHDSITRFWGIGYP